MPEDHRPRSAQYNLLFERFLNPERVSMPDFDIDFCQESATA
jgi:DNA polymerase III alpha subunit